MGQDAPSPPARRELSEWEINRIKKHKIEAEPVIEPLVVRLTFRQKTTKTVVALILAVVFCILAGVVATFTLPLHSAGKAMAGTWIGIILITCRELKSLWCEQD